MAELQIVSGHQNNRENSRMYEGVNLDSVLLTSRSAIECYQLCNYKRYLQYFYDGVGIVPSQRSIPLTTGNEVHKGVEYLLSVAKLKKEYSKIDTVEIDNAVSIAIKDYHDTVKESGLYGKGTQTDVSQKHTFEEQKALIEALIRAWAIIELPDLMKRFNIVQIEKEILVPMDLYINNKFLHMQTRCDAVFQEKSNTKEYLGYSLKSQKSWSDRAERGYKKDLQGVIEKVGIEHFFKFRNELLLSTIRSLEEVENLGQQEKIVEYLKKQIMPDRIMGIRFCFLIKGDRREDKINEPNTMGAIRILDKLPDSNPKKLEVATKVAEIFVDRNPNTNLWFTDSPLIYSYKKITPSEILYAHSDKTVKPENKSGFGKLGKGWEWFKVWECEEVGFIKGWIDLLSKNEIQPELGDVLSKIVYRPLEFYRGDREIERRWRQVCYSEGRVFETARNLKDLPSFDETLQVPLDNLNRHLDKYFPQNTHACHFPVDCEYLKICFGEEPYTGRMVSPAIGEDPIGSGEYVYRVPHHKGEFIQVQNVQKKEE